MSGWTSRRLYDRRRPPCVDRTEADAVWALCVSCYSLVWVRRDQFAPARLCAKLGGVGRGIGPTQTRVLDLSAAREIVVRSTEPGWQARRATLADLPPALAAAWPREGGKLVKPGLPDNGSGRVVDEDELWRIARRVTGQLEPEQASLFG